MEILNPELALYGSKNGCTRTNTFSTGAVSLGEVGSMNGTNLFYKFFFQLSKLYFFTHCSRNNKYCTSHKTNKTNHTRHIKHHINKITHHTSLSCLKVCSRVKILISLSEIQL